MTLNRDGGWSNFDVQVRLSLQILNQERMHMLRPHTPQQPRLHIIQQHTRDRTRTPNHMRDTLLRSAIIARLHRSSEDMIQAREGRRHHQTDQGIAVLEAADEVHDGERGVEGEPLDYVVDVPFAGDGVLVDVVG